MSGKIPACKNVAPNNGYLYPLLFLEKDNHDNRYQ